MFEFFFPKTIYKSVHGHRHRPQQSKLDSSTFLYFVFLIILNNQFQFISSSSSSSSLSASINNRFSNESTKQQIIDTSNLLLDYCENCDLYLGGLFPIHAPKYSRDLRKKSNTSEQYSIQDIDDQIYLNEITCGEIKKERGIQRLEAMLFAIDLINNSTELLPNLRIGAKIYDTCDRDTIALDKCLKFVSDHFLINDAEIVNDFSCPLTNEYTKHFYNGAFNSIDNNNNNNHKNNVEATSGSATLPQKNEDRIYKRKIAGVIGAASSSVSIQVANLLRLFQVPQISYASTSPELSNKERFPFFSRVLPSDKLQAEAMASLVYHLDWNYIATISEEGNLGGIDSFITNAKAKRVCIAASYTLSQTASEDYVEGILNDMYKEKNARAVVMFLQDHNIRKLLDKVSKLNLTGHFLWVASDSWGTKKESINSNDLAAEGAITFLPKSYEIIEFNKYFKNLKPTTNKRNPWFAEYWEEQFNCTMSRSISYSYSTQARANRPLCTGEEALYFAQDGFVHFVIDSVFAMAHAIHNLVEKYCTNLKNKQLFDCIHKKALNGKQLLKAIRDVEFESITKRKVKFIKDKENTGDGLAPFEIFQYQEYESGKFGYKKISEWEKDKPFVLNKSLLKWRSGSLPRSVCKEECGIGEIKQGDDCCWVCVRCEENEYVSSDRKHCIQCERGYGPNDNKTRCEKLDIEYLTFNSPFTIIPIIFSSLGIIVTSYCVYVFIRYSQTPIIKASGRELCYVLLAGIMLCYLITFPLVTKPTVVSCFILRFGVSLSLTICLSALFTKTNRLSRIFNSSIKKVRQASYVSPMSQLVICFSIISVQIIGIIVWTIIVPPDISFDYDDPKRVILQCNTQYVHLAISFAYNMFLVVLCTIYAVKTRKIPENFNEARFIGFTMYSICIIWSAFIPIYFGTTAAAGSIKAPKNNYRIQLTTMAMCLSLSATVILFCIFLPKLRVVVLKPNKNVRTKTTIGKAVFKPTHINNDINKQQLIVNHSAQQPTNTEKSLTIATGVSSASTASSPGLQHNRKLINKDENFKLSFLSVKRENSSLASHETIESKREEETVKPIDKLKFNTIKENGDNLHVNTTNATNNNYLQVNNVNVNGTQKAESKNNLPSIDENNNFVNKPSEKQTIPLITTTNSDSNKPNKSISFNMPKLDGIVELKASDVNETSRMSQDESNESEQLIPSRNESIKSNRIKKHNFKAIRIDFSRSDSEENNCYYYLKLNPSNSNKKQGEENAANNIDCNSSELNANEDDNKSSSTKSLLKREQTLNEISEDIIDEFNESTIKAVVEKCFNQLSQYKKLPSPCIYVKQLKKNPSQSEQQVQHRDTSSTSSPNSIKLIGIKPNSISNHLSKANRINDGEDLLLDGENKDSIENNNGNEDLSSLSSLSIDNLQIKQTVVEKAADLANSSTNTILLSGKNDVNELYSLKITFV